MGKLLNALRTWILVSRCRAQDKVFICKALQGDSDYNICINCDLTVSCNCQDYNGEGIIGNLNSKSLDEIFSGERASLFRAQLASGKLCVSTCLYCRELTAVSKEELEHYRNSVKPPRRGLMIENTMACNLRCTLCRRAELSLVRKRGTVLLGDLEKISKLVRDHKIERIAYFNLVEPFLTNRSSR
jgi:hypothetical protein